MAESGGPDPHAPERACPLATGAASSAVRFPWRKKKESNPQVLPWPGFRNRLLAT